MSAISAGTMWRLCRKFTDPPILECEKCHSSMKKLISQSTFSSERDRDGM